MVKIWPAQDVQGYVGLLDAFVDGGLAAGALGPQAFAEACVRLWTADRDLTRPRTVSGKHADSEQLLRAAAAGSLEPDEFGSSNAGSCAAQR